MLRVASYITAGAAVAATLGLMTHESGSVASLFSGFSVWAVLPYAAFAGAARLARLRSILIVTYAVELGATLYAAFGYYNAFFLHLHSTSALVFIFIPLYQLLGAGVVLIAAATLRPRATKSI